MRLTSQHSPRILLAGLVAAVLVGCGLPTARQVPLSDTMPFIFTSADSDGTQGLTALHINSGQLLWKIQAGFFNRRPVILNGVLYGTAGQDAYPGEQTVVAVHVSDGKLLWHTQLDADFSGTLAVDSSVVAVSDDKAGVYALNPADGSVRWHVLGGGGQEFAVHDGIVYAVLSGYVSNLATNTHLDIPSDRRALFAFSGSTGVEQWHVDMATVSRVAISDQAVFVASPDRPLVAYDAGTGHLLWQSTTTGDPVVANERLLLIKTRTLGSSTGATHLQGVSTADGQVLWDSPADVSNFDVNSWAFMAGDRAYGIDYDQVVAVRISDGSLAWRVRLMPQSIGSIISIQGVLFAQTHSNGSGLGPCFNECDAAVTALDAKTGQIYWRRDMPSARLLVVTEGE